MRCVLPEYAPLLGGYFTLMFAVIVGPGGILPVGAIKRIAPAAKTTGRQPSLADYCYSFFAPG